MKKKLKLKLETIQNLSAVTGGGRPEHAGQTKGRWCSDRATCLSCNPGC